MAFDFVNTRIIGESGSQQFGALLGGTTTITGTVSINSTASLTYIYASGSVGSGKLYFNNGLLVSASGL